MSFFHSFFLKDVIHFSLNFFSTFLFLDLYSRNVSVRTKHSCSSMVIFSTENFIFTLFTFNPGKSHCFRYFYVINVATRGAGHVAIILKLHFQEINYLILIFKK